MTDWVRDVYENHRRLLFRVAWLVLRRNDLAEDAVHNAFRRIVGNCPSVNGNAKAYVMRAVRNAAIDLRRKQSRQDMEALEGREPVNGESTRSRQTDNLHLGVEEALERLDETTQEIIHLHIHENMTFREIGELTGSALTTVASRYRRGLKQIETRMKRDE